MKLKPGTVIARQYRVDAIIGAGGMGAVWYGVRLADNLPVAVKVLLPVASNAREVYARFRREAQVLARVDSPFAAKVIDFLSGPDGFVLVMEYIPGKSLHATLAEHGVLDVPLALSVLSDVLHGLKDLHNAGIVHRDLKPGNVVLRPGQGPYPRAILIDFGVSRIVSDSNEDEELTAITRSDRVLGTIEYMAPEQILGSRTVTGTADLYAAGAMAFRAMAGHHVFGDLQEGALAVAKLNTDAPRLPTVRNDEVGVRTQDFIARLLSRRVRDRFASAEQALEDLTRIRALLERGPHLAAERSFQPKFGLSHPAPSLPPSVVATAIAPRDSGAEFPSSRRAKLSFGAAGAVAHPDAFSPPQPGPAAPPSIQPQLFPPRPFRASPPPQAPTSPAPSHPASLQSIPLPPGGPRSSAHDAAATSSRRRSTSSFAPATNRSRAPRYIAFALMCAGTVLGALTGVSYNANGIGKTVVSGLCEAIGTSDTQAIAKLKGWVIKSLE